MAWLDFFIAAILAGILAAVVVSVAARRREFVWPGYWFYFTILLLAMWAVRLWLNPVTWPGYGGHLLVMIALGVVVALVMLGTMVPREPGVAATLPRPEPDPATPPSDLVITGESATLAPQPALYSSGLLYWVLIIALAGAVIAGLIVAYPPAP